MRKAIKAMLAVGVVAAASFMASPARADLIPTLVGSAPTVGPVISGTQYYTWTWSVSLSAAENMVTNNFVTIYDVAGLLSGSETGPANWSGSDMLTGVNGAGVFPIPGDDPAVPNVVFVYTGAPTVNGPVTSLGEFSILSTQSVVAVGAFTAQALNNSGPEAGSAIGNTGSVSVPAPTSGQGGPPTPLPAALPVGLGLLAAMGLKRKFATA